MGCSHQRRAKIATVACAAWLWVLSGLVGIVQPCMLTSGLRRVLVTGGNKGIGRALSRQLAAEHGFHVLLGSRDEARGAEAVKYITDRHPDCKDRVEMLSLDASSDDSVQEAAAQVSQKLDGECLYAIVNNAGVGFSYSMADTLGVNAYGPKRVCDSFIPLLDQGLGRIVNTASASGPMYVNGVSPDEQVFFTNPDVTWEALDKVMQDAIVNPGGKQPYGFSKACLNSYTMLLARTYPQLKINSMSPGYILTDITRGMGATKSPEEGTKAAIHLLTADLQGNGHYYGSDAVRSPMDRYRSPGDPPYTGP